MLILVKARADCDLKDGHGLTAIQIARENRQCMRILCNAKSEIRPSSLSAVTNGLILYYHSPPCPPLKMLSTQATVASRAP